LWCWPCGRNSQPKPECHQRRDLAPRGGRRGLLVFDCGVGGVVLYRRYPPARWPRPYLMNARAASPLFLRAALTEGREGFEAMTGTERDQAALGRGEFARGRGARHRSLAIDARRRLNPSPVNAVREQTRPAQSERARYAFLNIRATRTPTVAAFRQTRSGYAPS
jgi:hypothetical protein